MNRSSKIAPLSQAPEPNTERSDYWYKKAQDFFSSNELENAKIAFYNARLYSTSDSWVWGMDSSDFDKALQIAIENNTEDRIEDRGYESRYDIDRVARIERMKAERQVRKADSRIDRAEKRMDQRERLDEERERRNQSSIFDCCSTF